MSGTVFFHASEAQDESLDGLWIGAPVEFVLQNRQGKDVATQIRLLPPGTVNFDVRTYIWQPVMQSTLISFIYVHTYVCMHVCVLCANMFNFLCAYIIIQMLYLLVLFSSTPVGRRFRRRCAEELYGSPFSGYSIRRRTKL